MTAPDEPLKAALSVWLEDRDAAALEQACAWVKTHPVDIAGLLDWLAGYDGDREACDLAARRLRFALGLPVIPGPICRR